MFIFRSLSLDQFSYFLLDPVLHNVYNKDYDVYCLTTASNVARCVVAAEDFPVISLL